MCLIFIFLFVFIDGVASVYVVKWWFYCYLVMIFIANGDTKNGHEVDDGLSDNVLETSTTQQGNDYNFNLVVGIMCVLIHLLEKPYSS